MNSSEWIFSNFEIGLRFRKQINQSFIINFSDSTSTFIANSPNNAFYASNNTIPTWSTIPRTSYPYALIVPKADNSLTTILLD